MPAQRKRKPRVDQADPTTSRDIAPQAAAAVLDRDDLGSSVSAAALLRLNDAIAGLRALRVAPLLQDAVAAIRAGEGERASKLALEALAIDDHSGHGWHVLAIARELCADYRSAIAAYESALALLPDHADVANDLGRLAYQLGMTELAAQLFVIYRHAHPDCAQGANNLACVLRDLHDFDGAVGVLKAALTADPSVAMLWNTLATVLIARGETRQGVTFLEEALRLEPRFAKALYTRARALSELGDATRAIEDCDRAIDASDLESDRAMMRFARAEMLLAGGRVGEGWDQYEARFARNFTARVRYATTRPCWTPDTDLSGRSLLLVGEQGLGDQVMFANCLPDIIEALGPAGRLTAALEPRLIPLFARSFPTARFTSHETYNLDGHAVTVTPDIEESAFDVWAPLASPLRRFRRSVDAFPPHDGYLAPDPERVAHWRAELAALPGRTVGVLWKSLRLEGVRQREFSPFEQWRPVLTVPDVTFVNLQYGECEAELEQARTAFGIEIWRPPGLDLKHDLDDLAALASALDLVLGPANATTNIAGACGVPVWLLSAPAAWPRLGTDRYPWYPATRAFIAPAFGQWDAVMSEVAQALRGGS